ncbi:hypothetical protein MNBD_GAMMA10-1646 [hydrothermal vent metagenome]|uniref:Uncharacterized protein n=1 Tax=hydrothermal vent metagenome TaxID=652676 RepID=A0A3B0XRS2_9ZZZZ
MKNIILIMLFLTASVASSVFTANADTSGKEKYLVDDISPSYYAKIEEDRKGNDSAIIQIYQRGNSSFLFQVKARMVTLDFDADNKNATQIKLPYAKQELIIYDDFNFDKVNDFAIFDGRNSCYGGPSFQIYLAQDDGRFKLSTGFTRLAQEYCGMFNYYADKKQLQVSTKSGCCNFETSTFILEKNEPKAIKVINDSYTGRYIESEISRWNGSRMIKTRQKKIYDEGDGSIQEIFVFSLAKNNKKQVKLFIAPDDKVLNYAFINKENIEFNYPKVYGENKPFVFTQSGSQKTLVFYNGKTKYSLYQNENAKGINKIGILVTTNGKNYDLAGDLATLKGRLDGFGKEVTNVSYEQ